MNKDLGLYREIVRHWLARVALIETPSYVQTEVNILFPYSYLNDSTGSASAAFSDW